MTEPIIHSVNHTGRTEFFEGAGLLTTLDEIEEQEARLNMRISDFYEFKVERLMDCEIPGDPDWHNNEQMEVHLMWPLSGIICRQVIIEVWSQCVSLKENKGRGGSLQAGCLRYGVRTLF